MKFEFFKYWRLVDDVQVVEVKEDLSLDLHLLVVKEARIEDDNNMFSLHIYSQLQDENEI